MKKYLKLFKDTYKQWMLNQPFQQSAIIAYYTLFSLPSLLVIVITVAGYFFGKAAVQNQITGEIEQFIGLDAAQSIEDMIANVSVHNDSTIAIIFGLAMLIFGATGAFFQLKKAMNKIWSVREKKTNFTRMILDRAISFGMILVIGFMLIVSLVITTLVTVLGKYISQFAPEITAMALDVFNFLISYVFIGILFAGVFKILPDIKVRWKITFVGASLTTLLFLIGEYALSYYFGQSSPTSVYGGASSVVLIMLWVFYTCLIMFFGAEFTVQYALFKGEKITPNKFAEPAITQDLEDLKQERIHAEKRKKVSEELASNSDEED